MYTKIVLRYCVYLIFTNESSFPYEQETYSVTSLCLIVAGIIRRNKYQLDDLMFCFLLCPWELNRHLRLASNYTLSQIYSAPPHINFMLLFLKFPAATTSTLLTLSICPCSYITEKIGIPHFHYYILQPPIIVPSILPSFLLLWISSLHYQTIHFTMN